MKEIVYSDYEKMIKKVAWQFAKDAQHAEELIAEGNLEYVKALIKFDSEKSCFSTYLYNRLHNHFINLNKKWHPTVKKVNFLRNTAVNIKHTKNPGSHEMADAIANDPYLFIQDPKQNPERSVRFKQAVENLSETAKEIVQLVFNTPDDLYLVVKEELKLNKEMIRPYLRKRGWKFTSINDGFKEIATALTNL
jgi:RNA polymerase sigma factor (sigma-70 family)